jgi:hypothetical protein
MLVQIPPCLRTAHFPTPAPSLKVLVHGPPARGPNVQNVVTPDQHLPEITEKSDGKFVWKILENYYKEDLGKK